MNMDFILNGYIIPDKTMTMNGRISRQRNAGAKLKLRSYCDEDK